MARRDVALVAVAALSGAVACQAFSYLLQKLNSSKQKKKDSEQRIDAEAKLITLGIRLPKAPQPMACYVTWSIVGSLLYTSGHGGFTPEGVLISGKVGEDMKEEDAIEAARHTALHILATVRQALGSLNRVKRVVKAFGLVNCTDNFKNSPKVINGASQVFVDIYGEERGRGVRSAIGTNALPSRIPVEIEMIFEIYDS